MIFFEAQWLRVEVSPLKQTILFCFRKGHNNFLLPLSLLSHSSSQTKAYIYFVNIAHQSII